MKGMLFYFHFQVHCQLRSCSKTKTITSRRPFARLMSKNEDIRMTKLLMQQRLSNGAPSPKLSKMLEILVDHYSMFSF